MTQFLKDLPKAWKYVLATCTTLGVLAGGISSYKAIKAEIVAGIEKMATPLIEKKATEIVKEEMIKLNQSKETSYRHTKAEAMGIPVDSLLAIDAEMYQTYIAMQKTFDEMDSVHMDRTAIAAYLQDISMYIWRELKPIQHKGVKFGRSDETGLTFYMFNGFIFEAYYKGSTDSYWFKDSYGTERECH